MNGALTVPVTRLTVTAKDSNGTPVQGATIRSEEGNGAPFDLFPGNLVVYVHVFPNTVTTGAAGTVIDPFMPLISGLTLPVTPPAGSNLAPTSISTGNMTSDTSVTATLALTVRPMSAIATTVFDASTTAAWSGSEMTGASAYDTSSVSTSVPITATGTVSYMFYANGVCQGSGSPAGMVSLDAAGNVPDSAAEQTLAAGSYSFQATYSGDSNYSGSTSACEPFTVVDRTPPSITYSLSPAPNSNGWNNSQVTVTFTCADTGGPGIFSCPAPRTLTGEGADQQVSGTAVDNAGNAASVTATVSIDETPPTITATASPAPNGDGWNNTPVTVTYTCADALSGIATCPDPVTKSADGTYLLSGTATDKAGNTSAPATTTVNLDTTPPVVSNAAFGTDPKSVSQSSDALTAQVTDPVASNMSSGIATAQYYDPVQQAWLPMMLNGGTATATITTSATAYPSGMYAFKVRTTDNAGNVSQPVTAYLDVYNPSGGYAAGHGTITPGGSTSDPGDTLPPETGSNVRADFNFTVRYATTTDTTPSGSSIFTWGSNCNSPHGNCFSMTTDFSGTVVPSWLIVSTTTGTATFQGSATLTQGTTSLGSDYPVRITTTSGAITGTSSHYLLQIYPVGSNPDTAAPLYQASGDLTGGQVVVHQ